MSLDINTKKGQESLKKEAIMLNYVKNKWKVDIIETDKEVDAVCDGFIVKNGIIRAVFESKCRNLSLDELENFGSWLVTYEKIEKCKLISKMLKVPFIGLLYLEKDNLVMYWVITNNNGEYLFDFNKMNTRTQKTINGGTINRINAYLPVENGNFI